MIHIKSRIIDEINDFSYSLGSLVMDCSDKKATKSY